MKVRDLIKELLDYNMDAEVSVIAHCKKEKFSMSYGGGEGMSKEHCNDVGIYVDRLCSDEQES